MWYDPTAPDLTPREYHPNAHLTPIERERLIRQHLNECRSLVQLAIKIVINERTAPKWLARFR